LEGRTLADWPKDVEALAEALGISSFAVVGVSAGGSPAAACAALIPGRLRGVALVSSSGLAKYNWGERPEAVEEWSPEVRAEFDLAQKDPAAAANLAAEHFADEVNPLEKYPDTSVRNSRLPKAIGGSSMTRRALRSSTRTYERRGGKDSMRSSGN
jgi:pimeloyl-ACP methyl ester carboxylesterase